MHVSATRHEAEVNYIHWHPSWRHPSFGLASSRRLLWPDGADGRGPVGERVPLTLDAGAVGVEGLTDPDDVQARLIGQLGQELRDLRGRFVGDDFLSHCAIH